MAEPVGSDYQVRWLEEKVRLMQGTIDYVESVVEGLRYELRVRDFRIRELEQENRRLRKRLEEQAPPPPPPAAPPPPFVKPNQPPGRRKRPGRKAGHEAAL